MSTRGLRKCCHCGTWYKPDPRNCFHQRFCSKPECQATSKRISQQKWCRKNPDHFRGKDEVKRVQDWRRGHPGYWKRRGARAGSGPPVALQEIIPAQSVDNALLNELRNQVSSEISLPLQEIITAQNHVITGLTAMVTGDTLQEDIAAVLSTCYERGQRIGGIVPWMKQQELTHERTRTDCSAKAATYS